MKILLTGTEVYDPNYPETRKNQCGFGIMMRQIADMLSVDDNTVDIITQSNFTKGITIDNIKILKKTLWSLMLHLKLFYLVRGIKIIRMRDLDMPQKARILLYFITGSYVEDTIKNQKYDVVHINGIGTATLPIMYACARTNTPFFLTLHGLVSFTEKTSANVFSKRFERNYFKITKNNRNAYASIVGSGGKAKLEQSVGQICGLLVIGNPLIMVDEEVKTLNKLSYAKKVILCVGNITEQKNQKMVIDAFLLLPDEIRKDLKLIIIGDNKEKLFDYINISGETNIILTGALPRKDVESYYRIADLCITASVDEGFGLPLIEAYSNGVPCIIPEKIDAFMDIFDPQCAISVKEYRPELFRNAIIEGLAKDWDYQAIVRKSKNFSFNTCRMKYLGALRVSSKKHKCAVTVETLDNLLNESSRNA